ncbi:penicillin-binding protein activator [Reyranella sp.]|jgi:ABC-type branched-subunit amino acid transport system substrate-binding protein|uniref:penicillin-binding protein activator n=1 Tax=Reyranella sp. TaxID=1929291 RepID=UPI002F95D179
MRSSLVALATAALLLAACAEPSHTSTAPPPKPAGPQAGSPTTPSGKTRIALLLPLSGRAATIGRSMQQAAEMSLFDSGGRELALAAYDSGATPDTAVDAYNRARVDGCALVLGPLFGSSASALAPLVKQGGANVIAFSNDEKAAQPGVWIMGIAAPPQVRRVVDYAISQGIRRFAVFAPRTAYGDQMSSTLQDEAAARGATVVGVEQFDPRSLDLTGAAKRLATDIAGDGKVAILMPVAPPQLSSALASLSAAEIDTSKVQLIGTGVWDAPGIGSDSALRGAWYAAPDPARRADFERRYLAIYGRPPERLATLAYDAVALAAQLARGRSGGSFSADAITNPNGWTGVDGPIRFLPDGRSQRALAVIEIQGDRSVVVSPAPSAFGQAMR